MRWQPAHMRPQAETVTATTVAGSALHAPRLPSSHCSPGIAGASPSPQQPGGEAVCALAALWVPQCAPRAITPRCWRRVLQPEPAHQHKRARLHGDCAWVNPRAWRRLAPPPSTRGGSCLRPVCAAEIILYMLHLHYDGVSSGGTTRYICQLHLDAAARLHAYARSI
jgi:hypothetical protein